VQDILWYGADLTAQVHPEEPPVVELPATSPVPLPVEPAPPPAEAPELEAEDPEAPPTSTPPPEVP
jgi:hypothetical protein